MSCRICGRNSCCESFHSIEEQESFYKYEDKTTEELKDMCIENDDEIAQLKEDIKQLKIEIEKLEKENQEYFTNRTG
jgi:uncharacterized coiled-coil protein SlyX